MDLSDPGELLALPPRREEINRILGEVFAKLAGEFYSPPRSETRLFVYREARKTLLEGLGEIKKLAEEGEHKATRAYRDCREKKTTGEKILAELDEINRRISSSTVKDVAGFLFPLPSELESRLESPPSEPLVRYLELSSNLYCSLAEAAGYHLSVLCAFPPKGSKI
jgi:hypothetical protein